MIDIRFLTAMVDLLRRRWTLLREAARARPDGGYSTEAIVVIALLVAAALTAVGLITAKVIAKAGSLNLG